MQRQQLVRQTSLADIQQQVVGAEQGVNIAGLKADASVKHATGEAEAIRLRALGEAEAIRATGDAKAQAYRAGVESIGVQVILSCNSRCRSLANEMCGLYRTFPSPEPTEATASWMRCQRNHVMLDRTWVKSRLEKINPASQKSKTGELVGNQWHALSFFGLVGCPGFAPFSRRLSAGSSLSKFATTRWPSAKTLANAKAELNRRSQTESSGAT